MNRDRETGSNERHDEFSTWSDPLPDETAGATDVDVSKTTPPHQPHEPTIPMPSTGRGRDTLPGSGFPTETRSASRSMTNQDPPSGDSDDHIPAGYPSSGETQEATHDWNVIPPPVFEPGNLVFGKYKLIKVLGEGGMGQVWLVENIQLDCSGALKLIKPEIAKSDKAWKRFKREAQVMAKLNHPNAVAVRDFGRAQSVAYIEMEYIQGQSLDKTIEEHSGKPFPIEWVTPIVEQVCSVLQEAHDHVDERTNKPRPIIHRDLKPSNLMLVSRRLAGQNLKVLDFGIAKMADDERESNLTGDAEYLGTAAFSSPEQIRSESVDGRSDIYSLGVILYQFLTGDLPFPGGPRRALVAHLMEPPRPFRETNPEAAVPDRIEKLVLQCLEKNPDQRPRSAKELSARFREALDADVLPKAPPKPLNARLVQVAAVFALVAAIGIGVGASLRSRSGSGNETVGSSNTKAAQTENPTANPSKADGHPVSVSGSDTPKTDIPPVPAGPAWKLPEGFKAVGIGANDPEGPRSIERDLGHVVFHRLPRRNGIYLPQGFTVEDEESDTNGRPNYIRKGSGPGMVRFRWITNGRFEMGNVVPRTSDEATVDKGLETNDRQGNPIVPHWVKLTGFYLQETEVTNGEFEAFTKDYKNSISKESLDTWTASVEQLTASTSSNAVKSYPAVAVDWKTATLYAHTLGGFLPTEAQWEYAARSRGLPRLFATRALKLSSKPKANLADTGGEGAITEVKAYNEGKDETDDSIFDMTGNVREWCRDAYFADSERIGSSASMDTPLQDPCDLPKPSGTGSEPRYVVRGGSYLTESNYATNIQRDGIEGSERLVDLGFRVVIELPVLIEVK